MLLHCLIALLCCRDPRVECVEREHASLLRHVPVPEAAELCTTNLEEAGVARVYERDVVDTWDGVGFHPEPVRPKRMCHVERGHVERDEDVIRDRKVMRLDP